MEKLLFTEAVLFIFTAKLMLLLLPFRICILTISSHQYRRQPTPDTLRMIKHAVSRANKLSCWKNICLVQAFAGRWMLQRRKIGSSLSIGIKKDPESKILAHAWLMVGKQEIVSGAKGYLPLMKY